MGITRYAHDLFISYSHIDNEPVDGAGRWVDQFAERLSVELWKRAGSKVSVWRDSKLAGSDIFDEVIQHHVQTSAVFVAIVSPAYLRSQASQDELTAFVHSARSSQAGLVLRNSSRVLPVMLYDISSHELPEVVRNVLGVRFYQDSAGGVDPVRPDDDEYRRMLLRISEPIVKLLRELRDYEPNDNFPRTMESVATPEPTEAFAPHRFSSPNRERTSEREDVFISYAREDAAMAQALARRLTAEKWQVFWDRSIPIGRTWDAVLEDKLDKVSSVLVLWSKVSIASEWVLVEANEAVDQHKLVPAFIEDVKPPLRFAVFKGLG